MLCFCRSGLWKSEIRQRKRLRKFDLLLSKAKDKLDALTHQLQSLRLAWVADDGARRKARAAALIEGLTNEGKELDQSTKPTSNLAVELTGSSVIRPAHQIQPEAGQSRHPGEASALHAELHHKVGFYLYA